MAGNSTRTNTSWATALVEDVLERAEEFRCQQALHARGIRLLDPQQRVAELMDVPAGEVMVPGKMQKRVRARSLLCYLAVREPGMTMTALALEPTLSSSAKKTRAIAQL